MAAQRVRNAAQALLWIGVMATAGCSNTASLKDAAPPPNVARGEYLTALLGCGQCHTEGALLGKPSGPWLAGSRVGVAYTADEHDQNPGVVFPKNLTPDLETGLGSWSEQAIIAAISGGVGHAGERVSTVMPWMSYSMVKGDDLLSIARYLKSLTPVRNPVPESIRPGETVTAPYVRVGLYVFTPSGSQD